MRKTVHSKLICSYIFIGIVGFLFATAGGSHFVETYLEEEVGARLYDSAVRFASDAVTVQQVAEPVLCIFHYIVLFFSAYFRPQTARKNRRKQQ